jgi:hypothetical protein
VLSGVGYRFVLPSQRRDLANPGHNLLNRLRLDDWEVDHSVVSSEKFQDLDLKEQLRRRIDRPPLAGIARFRRAITHAAQKFEQLASQVVQRNAFLVSSGTASRSRVRPDESADMLPNASFEAIPRSSPAASIVARDLVNERRTDDLERYGETQQPEARRSPL